MQANGSKREVAGSSRDCIHHRVRTRKKLFSSHPPSKVHVIYLLQPLHRSSLTTRALSEQNLAICPLGEGGGVAAEAIRELWASYYSSKAKETLAFDLISYFIVYVQTKKKTIVASLSIFAPKPRFLDLNPGFDSMLIHCAHSHGPPPTRNTRPHPF